LSSTPASVMTVPPPGMAHQDDLAGLRLDRPLCSGHVVLQRGQRVLDSHHLHALGLDQRDHLGPVGAVGERAVDDHHARLRHHGRPCRRGRRSQGGQADGEAGDGDLEAMDVVHGALRTKQCWEGSILWTGGRGRHRTNVRWAMPLSAPAAGVGGPVERAGEVDGGSPRRSRSVPSPARMRALIRTRERAVLFPRSPDGSSGGDGFRHLRRSAGLAKQGATRQAPPRRQGGDPCPAQGSWPRPTAPTP
jgi:hypothetical protein